MAIVQQLCCLIWKIRTCAQIPKEILGMVKGEQTKDLVNAKVKMLANELFHIIMYIAIVLQKMQHPNIHF
jgi:hypothetical protein